MKQSNKYRVKFTLSSKQRELFDGLKTKYRICTKGRRVGYTHGAAIHLIRQAITQAHKILWVDTVYSNIDRYFERYFLPVLKQLPREEWEYRRQSKELLICDSIVDFRSADRAENIEGFGYTLMYINEAGIILKGERGRYLWQNAILPMTIDYGNCVVYIGGTPKGKIGKDGLETTYYQLYQKALQGHHNFGHVNIPTDQNPFIDAAAVEEVKEELPDGPVRDQEFYGKFVDSSQGIIKQEWLHVVDLPMIDAIQTVRSWDIASTVKEASDYSAGDLIKYNGDMLQIEDVKRVKYLYPELKELIIATAESDGVDVPVLVELAGQQNIVLQDLLNEPRLRMHTVLGVKVERDKVTRAMPWITRLQAGKVKILRAAWNQDFIAELLAFTADDSHSHDDQLDPISQAWKHFNTPAAGVVRI